MDSGGSPNQSLFKGEKKEQVKGKKNDQGGGTKIFAIIPSKMGVTGAKLI